MPSLTREYPPLGLMATLESPRPSDRTVDVVFYSGAQIDRVDWDTGKPYKLQLSLDPTHVDLRRLNRGAPVLDSHSTLSISDQIGTVVPGSATVTKTEGRARLRFSKRPSADDVWGNIEDQILRNVSLGAALHKLVETTGPDGATLRTAVHWEPYEISMVAVPADMGAQVQASRGPMHPCEIVMTTSRADADRARLYHLVRL